jgi:hypothetical protein
VEPFGHALVGADEQPLGFHETDPRSAALVDLPWFLRDLAPEGFLGRAWLRRHPELGFPVDLTRWSGDDVLRYLAHHGAEAPGAWLIGPVALAAFRDATHATSPIDATALPAALPSLADQAAQQGSGSSPGGEQPKFTVSTSEGGQVRHWLVKYSPPGEEAAAERWRDLLAAEHLAHRVLADEGIDACHSKLIDRAGRRFLCVERFDRVGARGRRGLISLRPFDVDGVADELRQWSLVTTELVASGRLTPPDGDRARWLEAFGHAIANTDMHLGNLSLRVEGLTLCGLAPVYDMLPMFYAPRHGGELPTRRFQPDAWHSGPWPDGSLAAARALWAAVADDERVSDGFRALARWHLGAA